MTQVEALCLGAFWFYFDRAGEERQEMGGREGSWVGEDLKAE